MDAKVSTILESDKSYLKQGDATAELILYRPQGKLLPYPIPHPSQFALRRSTEEKYDSSEESDPSMPNLHPSDDESDEVHTSPPSSPHVTCNTCTPPCRITYGPSTDFSKFSTSSSPHQMLPSPVYSEVTPSPEIASKSILASPSPTPRLRIDVNAPVIGLAPWIETPPRMYSSPTEYILAMRKREMEEEEYDAEDEASELSPFEGDDDLSKDETSSKKSEIRPTPMSISPMTQLATAASQTSPLHSTPSTPSFVRLIENEMSIPSEAKATSYALQA